MSGHFGKHRFISGFDTRMVRVNHFIDRNARPFADFHGAVGDNCCLSTMIGATQRADEMSLHYPLSLAAIGAPTGMFETVGAAREQDLVLLRWQFAAFFQDYYAITPNLHFNIGVRAED